MAESDHDTDAAAAGGLRPNMGVTTRFDGLWDLRFCTGILPIRSARRPSAAMLFFGSGTNVLPKSVGAVRVRNLIPG